jgi:lipopolysaccharide transport system permease protein
VTVLKALINALIATSIWYISYIILIGFPKWTVFISPLILFAMIPLLLALGWIFSVIGLLTKDINQVIGLCTQALLFLTPIFYGIDVLPENLNFWIQLNPLTYLVEQFRLIIIYGVMPSLRNLAVFVLVNSVLAFLAYFFFKRVRSNFTDLI